MILTIVYHLLNLGIDYKRIHQIAGVLGFASIILLARRFRLPLWRMLLVTALSVGAGMLLARVVGLVDLLLYWRRIGREFDFLELAFWGRTVYYGALWGYYLTAALLLPRLIKKPRLAFDILTASATLGHGVGRFACYLARSFRKDGTWTWKPCCYGIKMEGEFYARFWDHRFPVQFVEAGFELILFAALLWLLFKGGEKWRGKLPLVYLTAYPIFRYIIEFYRGDDIHGRVGPMSFAQLCCLLTLIGVWLLCTLRQKGRLKPYPPDREDALSQPSVDSALEEGAK